MKAFVATDAMETTEWSNVTVAGVPLTLLAVAYLDSSVDDGDPKQDLEYWLLKYTNLDHELVDSVVHPIMCRERICLASAFERVVEKLVESITELTSLYDDRIGETLREFTYTGWYIDRVYCLEGTDVIIELLRYEGDERNIPSSLLHRLCTAEGVPTQYFRTERPETDSDRRSIRIGLF